MPQANRISSNPNPADALSDRTPALDSSPMGVNRENGYSDPAAITALVAEDMSAVDRVIAERLKSDIALINQLAGYVIQSGGKRLRPLALLLTAKALGYRGVHHTLLAAVIEFIHTATLLHDDVVDESALRRGRPTANTVWGNSASVLVGDFLYSRSFQMMADAKSMRVMEIMSDTTNEIAEGEVMQLLNMHRADIDESTYMATIASKTARLFQAAAELGAVLCQAPEPVIKQFASYGHHLGMAFQLVDDMLDYTADSNAMGKNRGDDLAEGKATLPVIHAMAQAPDAGRKIVSDAIVSGDRNALDAVATLIQTHGSLDYTANAAQREARLAIAAIDGLDYSEFKQALTGLAEFAVIRTY